MPKFDVIEFERVVIEGTEYGMLRGQPRYGTVYYCISGGVRFFQDCFDGKLHDIEKGKKLSLMIGTRNAGSTSGKIRSTCIIENVPGARNATS